MQDRCCDLGLSNLGLQIINASLSVSSPCSLKLWLLLSIGFFITLAIPSAWWLGSTQWYLMWVDSWTLMSLYLSFDSVLQIRSILLRIQIPGPFWLNNGSRSDYVWPKVLTIPTFLFIIIFQSKIQCFKQIFSFAIF